MNVRVRGLMGNGSWELWLRVFRTRVGEVEGEGVYNERGECNCMDAGCLV